MFTGGGGDSGCQDDDDDGYIFDAGWKDGVLVASVFGTAVFLVLLVVVVGLICPSVSDLLHGEEYRRIKELRSGSALYSNKINFVPEKENQLI